MPWKFRLILLLTFGWLMVGAAGNVSAQSCTGTTSTSYTTYECSFSAGGCAGKTNFQSAGCGLYPGAPACGGGLCGACLPVDQTCSGTWPNCVIGSGAGGVPCGGNATWYTSGCGCLVVPPTATLAPGEPTPPPGPTPTPFFVPDCYQTDRYPMLHGRFYLDQDRSNSVAGETGRPYNLIQSSVYSCGAGYTTVDTVLIRNNPKCGNADPRTVHSSESSDDLGLNGTFCDGGPGHFIRPNRRSNPALYGGATNDPACTAPAGWLCGDNKFNVTLYGSIDTWYNWWARPNVTCSISGPLTATVGVPTSGYFGTCTGGAVATFWRKAPANPWNGFSGSTITFPEAGTYHVVVNGTTTGPVHCTGNPDGWFNGGALNLERWIDCNGPADPGEDWITVTVTNPTPGCSSTTLTPAGTMSLRVGDPPATVTASVVPNAGSTVSWVDWILTGSSVTINPGRDSSFAYQTVVTPAGVGDSFLSARATVTNGVSTAQCAASTSLIVSSRPPLIGWFGGSTGDIVAAGGSLGTDKPYGAPPPYFIADSPGSLRPGMAFGVKGAGWGGSLDETWVNSRSWLIDIGSSGWPGLLAKPENTYFYMRERLTAIATQPVQVGASIVSQSTLTGLIDSAPTAARLPGGIVLLRRQGGLTLSGDINLGSRQAILLAEGGQVSIGGRVTFDDPGGLFMVIADQTSNIVAADSVGEANPAVNISNPAYPAHLEGIYYTQGIFDTGRGANKLKVSGTIVGMGGVRLGRTYEGEADPAQFFEFRPDLVYKIRSVGLRRKLRRDVAVP